MSHKHTFTACLQHYHLKMAFGSYFPSMHWFDPRSHPFSILLASSAFFLHPWHPFGILCIICASSVHPSGILAIFGILCASSVHPSGIQIEDASLTRVWLGWGGQAIFQIAPAPGKIIIAQPPSTVGFTPLSLILFRIWINNWWVFNDMNKEKVTPAW